MKYIIALHRKQKQRLCNNIRLDKANFFIFFKERKQHENIRGSLQFIYSIFFEKRKKQQLALQLSFPSSIHFYI